MKSPKWRQRTPEDQFVAIISSMEGTISNYSDGIILADAMAVELRQRTDELKSLAHFIANPKEW